MLSGIWAAFRASAVMRYAAMAGAAIVAVLLYLGSRDRRVRKAERKEVELEQRRETEKKVEAGRKAASDTKDRLRAASPDELDERLRQTGWLP